MIILNFEKDQVSERCSTNNMNIRYFEQKMGWFDYETFFNDILTFFKNRPECFNNILVSGDDEKARGIFIDLEKISSQFIEFRRTFDSNYFKNMEQTDSIGFGFNNKEQTLQSYYMQIVETLSNNILKKLKEQKINEISYILDSAVSFQDIIENCAKSKNPDEEKKNYIFKSLFYQKRNFLPFAFRQNSAEHSDIPMKSVFRKSTEKTEESESVYKKTVCTIKLFKDEEEGNSFQSVLQNALTDIIYKNSGKVLKKRLEYCEDDAEKEETRQELRSEIIGFLNESFSGINNKSRKRIDDVNREMYNRLKRETGIAYYEHILNAGKNKSAYEHLREYVDRMKLIVDFLENNESKINNGKEVNLSDKVHTEYLYDALPFKFKANDIVAMENKYFSQSFEYNANTTMNETTPITGNKKSSFYYRYDAIKEAIANFESSGSDKKTYNPLHLFVIFVVYRKFEECIGKSPEEKIRIRNEVLNEWKTFAEGTFKKDSMKASEFFKGVDFAQSVEINKKIKNAIRDYLKSEKANYTKKNMYVNVSTKFINNQDIENLSMNRAESIFDENKMSKFSTVDECVKIDSLLSIPVEISIKDKFCRVTYDDKKAIVLEKKYDGSLKTIPIFVYASNSTETRKSESKKIKNDFNDNSFFKIIIKASSNMNQKMTDNDAISGSIMHESVVNQIFMHIFMDCFYRHIVSAYNHYKNDQGDSYLKNIFMPFLRLNKEREINEDMLRNITGKSCHLMGSRSITTTGGVFHINTNMQGIQRSNIYSEDKTQAALYDMISTLPVIIRTDSSNWDFDLQGKISIVAATTNKTDSFTKKFKKENPESANDEKSTIFGEIIEAQTQKKENHLIIKIEKIRNFMYSGSSSEIYSNPEYLGTIAEEAHSRGVKHMILAAKVPFSQRISFLKTYENKLKSDLYSDDDSDDFFLASSKNLAEIERRANSIKRADDSIPFIVYPCFTAFGYGAKIIADSKNKTSGVYSLLEQKEQESESNGNELKIINILSLFSGQSVGSKSNAKSFCSIMNYLVPLNLRTIFNHERQNIFIQNKGIGKNIITFLLILHMMNNSKKISKYKSKTSDRDYVQEKDFSVAFAKNNPFAKKIGDKSIAEKQSVKFFLSRKIVRVSFIGITAFINKFFGKNDNN